MKLVTTTDDLEQRFGLKEAIKRIKEYGFDGYDCSLFESMKPGKTLSSFPAYPCDEPIYISYAKEIRAFADKVGLPCYQTHAPFPTITQNGNLEEELEVQKKAIEISGILGAEIIVIHPASFISMEDNFRLIYSKLLPIAEKCGVKIATENMFTRKAPNAPETVPAACGTPEEFAAYVDYPNNDNFTACLDLGHTHLPNTESVLNFIKTLGHNRIKALHVHDNDKIKDKHEFPFTGKTDWEAVCKALAEIDYSGNFTFEADATNYRFPDELLPYTYKLLEKTGRYLIGRIEAYKAQKES